MISKHLKLSIRLLLRSPFNAAVNILGLSIGFGVFFLLWQYTEAEFTSDWFLKDYAHIFRQGIVWRQLDKENNWNEDQLGTSHPEITKAIASDFSEITDYTRIFYQQNFSTLAMPHGSNFTISVINTQRQKSIFEGEGFAYADPNMFTFFGLPMIEGNEYQVLNNRESIVISENYARKLFGDEDAVGQMIFVNDTIGFQVSGIFKNLPANTHMSFDLVASTKFIEQKIQATQFTSDNHSYFRIAEGVDINDLQKKINHFAQKYWEPVVAQSGFNPTRIKLSLHLQPVEEIVFRKLGGDAHTARSRETLNFLKVLAVVTLMMAWINYINMVNTSHGKRLKEIIARKVAGARNRDLAHQFLMETLFLNGIAFTIAILLIQLLRLPINNFLQFRLPEFNEAIWTHDSILLFTLIVVVGTAIVFFVTTSTLYKQNGQTLPVKTKNSETWLSKLLTTVQYTSAIILIVYTFSIYQQLEFVFKNPMGINRRDVVVINLPPQTSKTKLEYFAQQVKSISGPDLTVSTRVTGDPLWTMVCQLDNDDRNFLAESPGGIDENFIPFYGLSLLAGRNFNPSGENDGASVIINEGMLKSLQLQTPLDAIGTTFKLWTGEGDTMKECKIIGVVKNFQVKNLFKPENPNQNDVSSRVILSYKNSIVPQMPLRKISVRMPSSTVTTLAAIEKSFASVFPDKLFDWELLDDHINNHYTRERVSRNQIVILTTLAIAIACFGLFALIVARLSDKRKEISIRKTLGAKYSDIGNLLVRTTTCQLLFSIVIGLPISAYLTNEYLNKYEVHIGLNGWVFIIPVMILMVIMAMTIAALVFKAARTNPVEWLRHE